ncbi:hypothetical protein PI23P_06765 [Polaribacter irgensii 23-P]|uniref:Uncharacterized protein n=1 Tax=Polaribacter irgensii 23-P TaxID=313594 RepID=A4BYR2_9FLAO|nr:hypothetical protein PI23P_06765 [Polaribacter irgensii 23-P]
MGKLNLKLEDSLTKNAFFCLYNAAEKNRICLRIKAVPIFVLKENIFLQIIETEVC